MSLELAVTIISLIVGLTTILNFIIARYSSIRKKGEEYGKLMNDIEHIKNGVDDLRESIKSIQSDIKDHERRLIKVEESTKSVHKRLNGIDVPGLKSYKDE